ncbi:UDP-N-acetyl-D-galactosamine dehydrogenase [Planomicrobium soli]|uniref:UDP-N-acetyl-D-galactosamine dehydrogenase n=2 Tax=Planomicrobium soli TaxID=1176648 RepID=A0A2P8H3J9_9BACL|nr:UDP-N-acetyl-D-galactosamine dehydrogenase [Planomicrobium soli]
MMDKLKIAVVGLGYIGLPIAIAFGKKYSVIGFDSKPERIKALTEGIDSINDVGAVNLKEMAIEFTDDPEKLNDAGFIIIAVPTKVDSSNQPDFNLVLKASKTVGMHMRKGAVVVYESSFYPGMTEEKCIPVLEKYSGFQAGEEFFVGYSQEHIKPHEPSNIYFKANKVVAGQSKEVCDFIAEVYETVTEANVFKAKSIRIAEMAKVFESTQRDVNIALMNELALICNQLGVNTLDVLETADAKRNPMKFAPNLIGGYSISTDPYFLAYKGMASGHYPALILAARNLNEQMGFTIARTVIKKIVERNHTARKLSVIVLGVTYKENESNFFNSKVIDLIRELQDFGIEVQVADPLANPEKSESLYGIGLTPESELLPASAVILAVPHTEYKQAGWRRFERLLWNKEGIVFDIKSVLEQKGKLETVELWQL